MAPALPLGDSGLKNPPENKCGHGPFPPKEPLTGERSRSSEGQGRNVNGLTTWEGDWAGPTRTQCMELMTSKSKSMF